MRVRVYFNLHKKVFSVMDKKTRHVVDHVEHIILYNVKFIVNENGRQRVLREKKKNVHAFVEGDALDMFPFNMERANVTYNPYKYSSFMLNGEPIKESKRCYMQIVDKRPIMYAV